MPERNITLSIVSHGQNALVNQLLGDVQRVCAGRVAHCRTPYFCVGNPDIRLPADPFQLLLENLRLSRRAP